MHLQESAAEAKAQAKEFDLQAAKDDERMREFTRSFRQDITDIRASAAKIRNVFLQSNDDVERLMDARMDGKRRIMAAGVHILNAS